MASGLPEVQGRSITAPGQIRDAGLADRAAASMYERVAQGAMQIGKALEPLAVKDGEQDAIRDWMELEKQNEGRGAGKITKRSGFLGLQTAGDIAYNNMMEALYLQKTQAALQTKAQELRNDPETFGNVEAFDTNFAKFVEGYSAELDPEFAEEFFLEAEKIRNATRLKIAEQRQASDQAEAISMMDASLGALEDEIIAAESHGALVGESGRALDDLYSDYAYQLAQKTNNPLYRYSKAEADRDYRAFKIRVTAATLTDDARTTFLTQGYASALQWADDAASNLGLPPSETATIRNTLRNEINLMRQNQSAQEAEQAAISAAARQAREEAAEEAEKRFIDAVNRNAPMAEKQAALALVRDLSTATRYQTLSGMLYGEDSKGMPVQSFAELRSRARAGEISEADLYDMNLTQGQLGTLFSDIEKAGDSRRRRAYDRISAAFMVPTGLASKMSDETRARMARDEQLALEEFDYWFDNQQRPPSPEESLRMVDSIIARKGTKSVLATTSRYVRPDLTGNVSSRDIDAAEDALTADLKAGRIAGEDAMVEAAILEALRKDMNNGR